MSDSTIPHTEPEQATPEEITSGLFAHLVMQQSNMAMMLMGKTPHPETGEVLKDTDAARLFIDLLEMLEVKTKGNLTKDEATLLKRALMATRMAFVESMDSTPAGTSAAGQPAAPGPQPAASAASGQPAAPPQADEEEHKKKFTKKY
jgi:hypothetical protein